MKKIPFLFSILIIGCSQPKKSINKQTKIDIESINHVYIKKDLYGTDSIRLNEDQVKLFVDKWNKAKSRGLYKMGPEFWITIKLKNDSVRSFKTNQDLIKENNDWTYSISDTTLIKSFWKPTYSFPNSKNYNPISFIKEASKTLKTEKDTLRIGMTMIDEFPIDWVKKEHIEPLFSLLESKEVCGCFLNPLSSYIPTDDFAEKGGYAGIFIKSFMENKKVNLGLYSCPKVDEELNEKLKKWWKENK